jgi:hypothetical protein
MSTVGINSDYPEMFEVYDPYDNGTGVDYSAGSFMDTEVYFSIYQYATAPDGTVVYSYSGGAASASDYQSTPFQIMLNWGDGGGSGPTEGYVIDAYDNSVSQEYWIEVPAGSNSLTITDFGGWNPGSPDHVWYGYRSPYFTASTGSLCGDQSYRIWAYKVTDGSTIHSQNYSEQSSPDLYCSSYGYGYANEISWDDVLADGYLIYNVTYNYYIEVDGATFNIYDDGYFSGWTSEEPLITVPYSYSYDFLNFFNDSSDSILKIKGDGQIVSTLIGTKPLDITSTTLVENLNADLLDGQHASNYLLNAQAVKYTGGLTMPTISGQSGKFLTTDGSVLSWGTALTAEADTFATVTARGATTTTPIASRHFRVTDGYDIVLGTTTGTKIGTATTQKLVFYGWATSIVQPANTVALDLVLTNLYLRAPGGTPSVSANFKIGAGAAGTDYTLTFDGETTDGVMTWMEDEDQFQFTDRIKTTAGRVSKSSIVTDTYDILISDETIVGNKETAFIITLPTASASVIGQIFTIKNIGAGVITVEGAGSDTIDGAANKTINQWGKMRVQCISANTWVII